MVRTVGITDHAQEALGELVYVELPEAGSELGAGDDLRRGGVGEGGFGCLHPAAGTLMAINEAWLRQPELVNGNPYGEGWLVRLQPADSTALESLMNARPIPASWRKLKTEASCHAFIPHTETDISEMLATIGVDSVDALFDEIP